MTTLNVPNAMTPEADVLTGGQPDTSTIRAAAEAGYKTVITTRAPGEPVGFDERALVESLGMGFYELPVTGANLNRQTVEAFDALMASAPRPILLHCGSGNRIGALYALREGWLRGADTATAMRVGEAAGMTGLAPAVRGLLAG